MLPKKIQDVDTEGLRLISKPKVVTEELPLISKEDAKAIKEAFADNDKYPDGKINKEQLSSALNRPKKDIKYSVFKLKNQFYAIYDGKKQKKIIGEGSFGKIKYVQLIGETEKDQTDVRVVKVVTTHPKTDVKALEREAEILKKFDKSNGFFKYQKNPDQEIKYFIEMSYIPGENLFDFINNHKEISRVDIIQLIEMFRLSTDSVKEFFDQGYLHRDLKPDNFIYNAQLKKMFLIDFGLSVPYKDKKYITDKLSGNNRYIAPELTDYYSLSEYGEATEVYALGVMFGEMLEVLQHNNPINQAYKDTVNEMSHLIKKMKSYQPRSRPSLDEVKETLLEIEKLAKSMQAKAEQLDPDVISKEIREEVIRRLKAEEVRLIEKHIGKDDSAKDKVHRMADEVAQKGINKLRSAYGYEFEYINTISDLFKALNTLSQNLDTLFLKVDHANPQFFPPTKSTEAANILKIVEEVNRMEAEEIAQGKRKKVAEEQLGRTIK